jgi:hypothetical protein
MIEHPNLGVNVVVSHGAIGAKAIVVYRERGAPVGIDPVSIFVNGASCAHAIGLRARTAAVFNSMMTLSPYTQNREAFGISRIFTQNDVDTSLLR